jgi:ubiquinone biosynthesis protein UbiJ
MRILFCMSIDQALSALAARAANPMIASEPWALAQLRPHAGQRFVVKLAPFALSFAIQPDGRLDAGEPDAPLAPANVRIELTPAALMSTGPERLKHVRIEGDAGLAHSLGELASQLRPDFEHALSGVVGDIAARRIAEAMRTSFEAARSFARQGAELAVDRAAYKDPIILAREPFAALSAETRALRDQLERLSKRIELIEKTSPKKGATEA